MQRLLIVDDEANIRNLLGTLFTQEGYDVKTAGDGEAALKILKEEKAFDCILSDLRMPRMDGMAFFEESRPLASKTPFVFITAYGSIEEAVFAIKSGAADFIAKPFDKEGIRSVVANLTKQEPFQEKKHTENGLVYVSSRIQGLIDKIRKLSKTNLALCIFGESGTGKEGLAKTLHYYHQQNLGEKCPFVSINCPAIPEALLESEIFGYRRGAFSGADRDFIGKIERADNGTLFFDEIGDLPLTIQPKLLRLLEERTYEPLGSSKPLRTQARFVFATNRDLIEMVDRGTFREDLYYRINTLSLINPPLRERKEDISVLAEHFLKQFQYENSSNPLKFHPDSLMRMRKYHWPGNVRELKNTIRAAAAINDSGVLFPDDLLPSHKMKNPLAEGRSLMAKEKEILLKALKESNWNISAAARMLEISRGSLRYKMEKLHIQEMEG